MTLDDNKPKRKEKSKNEAGNSSRWIVLGVGIVALMIVGGIVLMLFGQSASTGIQTVPDADPLTALCEFESPLRAVVMGRTETFVHILNTEFAVKLPENMHSAWVADYGDVVWGMSPDNGYAIIDIRENETATFTEDQSYGYQFASPSGRYMAKIARDEGGAHPFIIYSAETMAILDTGQTLALLAYWSPDETQVLFADTTSGDQAQVFHVDTKAFDTLQLPADTAQVLGWNGDSSLVYRTEEGQLKAYNLETEAVSDFADQQFDEPFSDGLSNVRSRYDWVIGFDTSGLFQVYSLRDPSMNRTYFVETENAPRIDILEHYIRIKYETTPAEYLLLYPETGDSALFTAQADTSPNFSEDGRYVAYDTTFGTNERRKVIQIVGTEDTFMLEEESIADFDWAEIEGETYILYATLTEHGYMLYYLLNADSKERCKVGTFTGFDVILYP